MFVLVFLASVHTKSISPTVYSPKSPGVACATNPFSFLSKRLLEVDDKDMLPSLSPL